MLCTKCGKENGRNENFCRYCGERLILPYENNQQDYRTNERDHSHSKTKSQEQQWIDFVGRNYHYYKFKWIINDHPENGLSWNWAASLFGILWLGYRRMYAQAFIILGLYLALDLVEIITGFHPIASFLANYSGLGIALFLALFGNALYYRHAKKKIAKAERLHPGERMEINFGGTSSKGVFATIGGLLGYALLAVFFLFVLTRGMILFGPNQRALNQGEFSTRFSQNEGIYYDVNLGERAKTDQLDILLYREDNEIEELYGQFEQRVEPHWFGFNGILITPYTDYHGIIIDPDQESEGRVEPGHYLVRVYRGDELLSEGSFQIDPSEF